MNHLCVLKTHSPIFSILSKFFKFLKNFLIYFLLFPTHFFLLSPLFNHANGWKDKVFRFTALLTKFCWEEIPIKVIKVKFISMLFKYVDVLASSKEETIACIFP